MRARTRVLTIAGLLIGSSLSAQTAPSTPVVDALGTTPTQQGGSNRAVLVLDGQRPLIVGTAELAGLELYDMGGSRSDRSPPEKPSASMSVTGGRQRSPLPS